MVQAIVRILLFATPLRLILAASTLWKDWDQQDLDYALEINARNLVVFSSRTFEPIQPFHQSLEDLTIDPHLTTKIDLIDCDVKGDLCKSHDVNEYPAIRLLKVDSREENHTKTVRYRGRRTVQAIRSFLRKHDHPLLLDVSSKDELDNFKRLDDVVIVAFLSGQWGKATEAFYSIAENRSESFVFGYTYNQQSASEEGVSVPAIVCYKNTDGDHQIFEGPFTEENIEMFLATAPEMVMRDFNEREIDTYMKVSIRAVEIRTTNCLILISGTSCPLTYSPRPRRKRNCCDMSSRLLQENSSNMSLLVWQMLLNTHQWRRISASWTTSFLLWLYTLR